jgi:hypothetical protein
MDGCGQFRQSLTQAKFAAGCSGRVWTFWTLVGPPSKPLVGILGDVDGRIVPVAPPPASEFGHDARGYHIPYLSTAAICIGTSVLKATLKATRERSAKAARSWGGRIRTLRPADRVTDLGASVVFYTALGYGQVGRDDLGDGASLTMLKFPNLTSIDLVVTARDL